MQGAAWGDVNNDGLIDLYVSILDQPNKLYLNRGGSDFDDWYFEEVATTTGVREPSFSFPVFFWDYNNDGWQDLFVASFDVPHSFGSAGEVVAWYLGCATETEKNRVYRNNGEHSPT